MVAASTFGQRFEFARDYQTVNGIKERDTDFAKAIGVSNGLVSGWKTAEQAPPVERCLAIAERCGVDPGWLAFGEKSKAPAPPGFRGRVLNKSGLRVAEPEATYPDPDATSEGKPGA